jgi:general stress protein 26
MRTLFAVPATRRVFAALALLAATNAAAFQATLTAQEADAPEAVDTAEISRADLIIAAREIMEAAANCALITVDADGAPHARAMDPFAPEEDMTVWFGTNPNSRKVAHIREDPRVTLYYFDRPSISYVTIHGTARLVDDPAEKALRWKEDWAAFYPNQDEAYMLIEVTPNRLEVVSPPRQILGEDAAWAVPATELGDG